GRARLDLFTRGGLLFGRLHHTVRGCHQSPVPVDVPCVDQYGKPDSCGVPGGDVESGTPSLSGFQAGDDLALSLDVDLCAALVRSDDDDGGGPGVPRSGRPAHSASEGMGNMDLFVYG